MTPDPNRPFAEDEGDGAQPDPMEVLSDKLKDAIRLSHEGLEAGEIAVRLNLRTKAAVHARIWEARQKLGGVSRREAGRMLAEAEQRAKVAENSQGVSNPCAVLAHPEPLWMAPIPIPGQQQPAVDFGGELRDERTTFEQFPIVRHPSSDRSPDRSGNDEPGRRILLVLGILLLTLAVLGLMKPVADGFGWLFDAVAPSFKRHGG